MTVLSPVFFYKTLNHSCQILPLGRILFREALEEIFSDFVKQPMSFVFEYNRWEYTFIFVSTIYEQIVSLNFYRVSISLSLTLFGQGFPVFVS